MENKPIAVIDSGVGGLACLGAIRKIMPEEDIIYFGDTAHMPYGTKSVEELHSYAKAIGNYLSSLGTKMVILACGTMSSTVIPFFYKEFPEMLVQGIIEPAVAATSMASQDGDKVGVIATPRCIESGSFDAAFSRLRKKLEVYYKGCPGLSDLIEKGVTEGPEMEEILKKYLDEMVNEKGIKTLLLGCTHYPLVTDCINKLYPELKIVSPVTALAKNANSLLKVHEMDTESEGTGSLRIQASKKTEGFENMAKLLGFGDIPVEEVKL